MKGEGYDNTIFWIILTVFFCVNLWHGHAMHLCHDEAYYWMYSRFLDWGYFDHPPMVAAAVGLGYGLLANELGVRLLFIVMQAATLILAWGMTDRKDGLLFWTLFLSFPLLRVGGILALPDMPLLFFATVFLAALERYIARDNWKSVGAVSVSAALMLYSKYHGVLVILFAVLALPRLLRRRSFWMAAGLSAAMLIPLGLWQASHDFVSVRFQLGREARWFNPGLILEYVVGQVGSAGAISGIIVFYTLFRYRSRTEFERVLTFNAAGVFVFFLVMSLRGKVEANWTLPAFIPLGLLAYRYLQDRRALRRVAIWTALVATGLSFAARMIFISPPGNLCRLKRAYEFSDWPDITSRTRDFAGELPIVACTYPHASSLSFYSGKIVPALNLRSRPNQFSLWRLEEPLLDTEVCLVSDFSIPGATEVKLRQGDTIYLLNGMTVREIKATFGRER